MAYCNVNPFSEYVKVHSAGDCHYSVDEVSACERLISDAIRVGGKQLKLTLRRLNLHPSHPVRKSLWPRLISARFSLHLPSDDTDSSDFGPTTDSASSTSDLAGYELCDQLLLPTFLLNDMGQKRQRDIMHQVVLTRPELVYAPQLWPLLALLLHYHSAPVARACLIALLRQPGLITQTKTSWIVQSLALERLGLFGFVPKNLRRVVKHSQGQSLQELRISLARWPIALWHLPFGYLVRLVDCFLLEGPKVFYRAGLLLWKLAASTGKSPSSTPTVPSAAVTHIDLAYAAQHLSISSSAFMRKLFVIRNLSSVSVQRALEQARQSEVSKSGEHSNMEDILIHPCKRAGQTTYASYLVGDGQSIDGTSGTQQHTHPSESVTVAELATLITSIRDNQLAQLSKPVLLFSSNRDGTSLRTLYARAAGAVHPASLLLVRSRSGRSVIGAFCADRWQARNQPTYFGSGLSFLFRVRPGPLTIYPWVGHSSSNGKPGPATHLDQFQMASDHQLQVGGGKSTGAPGLGLDEQFSLGTSGPSPTFASDCLITDQTDMVDRFGESDGQQACTFAIGLVELIGFQDL